MRKFLGVLENETIWLGYMNRDPMSTDESTWKAFSNNFSQTMPLELWGDSIGQRQTTLPLVIADNEGVKDSDLTPEPTPLLICEAELGDDTTIYG